MNRYGHYGHERDPQKYCPTCESDTHFIIERESILLFVYGTLKRGNYNNRLMKRCRFVGEARLAPHYVLNGILLLPVPQGTGVEVKGEVWEVDPCSLHDIDRLEGHPTNYTRTFVPLAEPMDVEGQEVRMVSAYVVFGMQVSENRITDEYARYELRPGKRQEQRVTTTPLIESQSEDFWKEVMEVGVEGVDESVDAYGDWKELERESGRRF